MGVARGFALVALVSAIFIFGLVAGLFIDALGLNREETLLASETPAEILPFDRIKEQNVHVAGDKVLIDLPGAKWATFSATGSMLPVLGSTAHALQIAPSSPSDIRVGDIISFRHEGKILSHRVIDAGIDKDGAYFITQGDNNPKPDPVLVRFSQIDRVLVGILY